MKKPTLKTLREGLCPYNVHEVHCVHWWDGEDPCCSCGFYESFCWDCEEGWDNCKCEDAKEKWAGVVISVPDCTEGDFEPLPNFDGTIERVSRPKPKDAEG